MLVLASRTVHASRASTSGGRSYDTGASTRQSMPAEASIRRAAASSAARLGCR